MRKSIVSIVVLSAMSVSAANAAIKITADNVSYNNGSVSGMSVQKSLEALNSDASSASLDIASLKASDKTQSGQISKLNTDVVSVNTKADNAQNSANAAYALANTKYTEAAGKALEGEVRNNKADQLKIDAAQNSVSSALDTRLTSNEQFTAATNAGLQQVKIENIGRDSLIAGNAKAVVDESSIRQAQVSKLTGDVATNKADITSETTSATDAESQLGRRVDNNDSKIQVVQGEVQNNRTAITNETQRATTAESGLQSQVDNKVDTQTFKDDQTRQDTTIRNTAKDLTAVQGYQSQLFVKTNENTSAIEHNSQRIDRNTRDIKRNADDIKSVKKSVKSVGALATATANLHYNRAESGYAVAVGEYKGSTAIAGGTQFNTSANTAVTLQVSYDGEGVGTSLGFHGSY